MTKTLQALIVLCIVRLTVRGVDLLWGRAPVFRVEWDVLTHAPIVWGVSALVCAGFMAVALILRKPKLVVLSCLTAFAIHFMFGVETLQDILSATSPHHIRRVTDHWCTAFEMLVLGVSVSFRHSISQMLLARGRSNGLD